MDKPDLLKAKQVLENLKPTIGYQAIITNENIGKLSIVGGG